MKSWQSSKKSQHTCSFLSSSRCKIWQGGEKSVFFPQVVYRMLALAHHYRSWRGSPDHTVRPGLYLHFSEATLKDLNLTYSLVSADFKAVSAILFPNLSNTAQSLAGCPSSANSSRLWVGVEDGEESYCIVCKYKIQQGEDMSSDGDKAATFIAVREGHHLKKKRVSVWWVFMQVVWGGLSGTLILVTPKLSVTICTSWKFSSNKQTSIF